jgi:hypothetical protein
MACFFRPDTHAGLPKGTYAQNSGAASGPHGTEFSTKLSTETGHDPFDFQNNDLGRFAKVQVDPGKRRLRMNHWLAVAVPTPAHSGLGPSR